MAQLLAGGIIALGILILALTFFVSRRQKKTSIAQVDQKQVAPISSPVTTPQVDDAKTLDVEVPTVQPVTDVPILPENTAPAKDVLEANTPATTNDTKAVTPIMSLEALTMNGDVQQPLWWRDQLQSLTSQLQYLREHAKDVERQIAILSEIAALVTELEMLQKKREISPEGKISIFPLHVHRQPTELSYTTDKRPTVRKYTIEALS